MSNVISRINQEQLKKDRSHFNIGDTVCVHTIVKEGDKERIQKFTGVVIGRRGVDINASFTVRRISYGEGVERVFPLHSPRIAKVEVESEGAVRRSKLNYLRDRTGKAAMMVKEKSQQARAAGAANRKANAAADADKDAAREAAKAAKAEKAAPAEATPEAVA